MACTQPNGKFSVKRYNRERNLIEQYEIPVKEHATKATAQAVADSLNRANRLSAGILCASAPSAFKTSGKAVA